jgi:glycosyltransferase involved in cell wall biosynthesis
MESRHHRQVDVVVVGYMGHLDVLLARKRFRRSPIALDHLVSLADTAADRRAHSSRLLRLLERADRAALGAADLVIVDTDEHAEMIPAAYRSKTVVVPVGADNASFEIADEPRPPLPPLRVVFFGRYIPLQGAPTIGRAISLLRERDDIVFTMIGTGQDLPETRRLAQRNDRVRWVDRIVRPEELILEARSHHVSLGVFGTGPKALRVVPTKLYQGAAMGCAVVTSDTDPQRRAFDDAAIYVAPGDAHGLAAAIEALADDPDEVESRRKAAARAADHYSPRAVTHYSPRAVTAVLNERLDRLACSRP